MIDNIPYQNEVLKRAFFDYLKNSRGYSSDTLEAYEGAILLWQKFTNGDYLGNFTKKRATDFRDWLKQKKKTGAETQTISLNFCYHMLRHLRVFFEWLQSQPNHKSKIIASDIEYLRLSKKDARMAIQPKKKSSPTVEEMELVIESMPSKTEVEMRNKALISLIYITGCRISAASSLSIACFDEKHLLLDQDPNRGVKTKNSKHIRTVFFPLPYKKPTEYILEWFHYLKEEKGFKETDPLFPATKIENHPENKSFYNSGKVNNKFWKDAGPIRKIFKKSFEDIEVPYYHPHSLRDTIVKVFIKIRLTEEEKKAISQNFGHENVGTTFGAYGHGRIDEDDQFEIINRINLDQKETLDKNMEGALRKIIREEIKKKDAG
ncbi:MAG: tyrosine-type recombinase/integrase [Candidatus Pacebacteria bacterium]|nr:tyrosine-type recombinase/integrase [Candidatus Paceibacterota bacterium]